MTSAQKAIKKVFLDSDVFTACLHHCLTSEKEEVLGLLIGKVDEASFCHVLASIVMHRSDKQPDRVEISAPQLCIATAYADKLSVVLGESVRVIGWYHSHPHITVWPSHVDVNTQFTYQMLDSFVGLIFAVYQNDPGSAGNTVQLTCFQSVEDPTHPGRVVRKDIELQIVNKPMKLFNLKAIVDLPTILSQEETHPERPDQADVNDPLTFLFNEALETLTLVHIASRVAMPLLEGLEARLQSAKARLAELERSLPPSRPPPQ